MAVAVLGLLFLLLLGALVGVVAGAVAGLARVSIGYRRTAGFLAFLVERLRGAPLDRDRLLPVVAAELTWYAVLGVGYVLVVMGLSLFGHLPTFYGALGYSGSAVLGLTVATLGYVAMVAALVLFVTDPPSRARYFDAAGLAGLGVGLGAFALALRATTLMSMYPGTHREIGSRAPTRLPIVWVFDLLPLPELAATLAALAGLAILARRYGAPGRDWQALLLVGLVGIATTPVVLLVANTLGIALWSSQVDVVLRLLGVGVLAVPLALVNYSLA